ncbi:hypothetical protein L484_006505 [Morus notabilis]|uniref:Ribosomal RNA-processing protein 14/surfeit locus protein 6 C-terminal domain-containing protein n=1 Tax=Morus notabilis TaxID=981085 RepID=W9SNN8_9ROSA|nr:hypothetical protein L484_006505 [Morus notabilis]
MVMSEKMVTYEELRRQLHNRIEEFQASSTMEARIKRTRRMREWRRKDCAKEERKLGLKRPEKGNIISKKRSWSAATSRASGIKVHFDPNLLKQSIQKEKRRQQKNAHKWKESILKAERQHKRIEIRKDDSKAT